MSVDIDASVIADFRTVHKAFTDLVKWPDDVVTDALYEADAETGGAGWGEYDINKRLNLKKRGMYFYAAHWLSSTYLRGASDDTDVDPSARLNVSSKSVGDESISFRITEMQATGDDWLSTTQYGVQFLRLRPRATMGARAV